MPSLNRRQILGGLAGAGALAALPKPRRESASPAGPRLKPDRARIRREMNTPAPPTGSSPYLLRATDFGHIPAKLICS